MDEHHLDLVARELERLEQRRVAAADHRDDLAPVQRPVAAGAAAEPLALELVLTRHAELARPRPRGDDDGACHDLARIRDHEPVVALLFEAAHLARLEGAAGVHDLLLEPRDELEAGHALREAGEVLDPLGVQHGAARAQGIQQDRASALPRAEERGGEPGEASAEDGDLVVGSHALTLQRHPTA